MSVRIIFATEGDDDRVAMMERVKRLLEGDGLSAQQAVSPGSNVCALVVEPGAPSDD